MKPLRTLLPGVVLVLAACDADPGSPTDPAPAVLASEHAGGPTATFEVTITNLTSGQPLTPPLALTHRGAMRPFVGRTANEPLKELAENGNLDPLIAMIDGSPHVADFVVAAGDPPPLLPGGSITFEIESSRGARFLSFGSMLICTNDGFTALNALHLPPRVGQTVTATTDAYDAGTEINTEDFADMVPPCPALTGVDTDDTGTGVSDPTLAENGVIRHHPGVAGIADLDPALHGWTDPAARVEVTRVN